MVKFSEMSRGKFFAVILASAVFCVGAVTLLKIVSSVTGKLAKDVTGGTTAGKLSVVKNAAFAYWVPGSDPAWTFDPRSKVVDQAHGVITYAITFASGSVPVKVSQQQMPEALKPVGGSAWKRFIDQEKPITDQPVGDGTIYYLPALANGTQVSDGSDTIIFSSDNILMFGQAGSILKSAQWSSLP